MKFYDYLTGVRDYSSNTIDNYMLAIQQFKDFIDCKLEKADINDIDKFVQHLQDKNYQNSTINLKINGIKSYYKFLRRKEGIESNILQREQLTVREKVRNTVTKTEINDMLLMLDDKRKKAILSILFQTGIRISELINIKRENLTKHDEYVKIVIENSKRKRDRIVFMDYDYFQYVNNYIKTHNSDYVICSKWDKQLSSRHTSRLIKEISKETLGEELSAHDYRASCFTHYHRQGMDIYRIAELAGHSSIQTTKEYIQADEHDLSREFISSF